MPEFAGGPISGGQASEDAVKQLIARSADTALPSALTEQEAAAFASSLTRFLAANAGAGNAEDSAGLPQGSRRLFDEVDAAVAHTDLGLRGKLGGRRIVLDCVTQAKLAAGAGAECGLRAVAQISGNGQFEPTPAQLLDGQKWALAQP